MFCYQFDESAFGKYFLSNTLSCLLLFPLFKRSTTATITITTMKIIADATDKATVRVFDLPFLVDLVLSKIKLRWYVLY